MYALWNNGSPHILRTTKNVKLPNGKVVADVVAPIPEQGLFRYEERPASPAAHQRASGMAYTLERDVVVGAPVLASRPLEEVRAEKLAALAAHRYAIETGGLTLQDGTRIGTDREHCAIITGKTVYLGKKPNALSVKWKGRNGFVEIPRAQFEEIAIAVVEHVQRCFDKEAQHAAEIEALASPADVAAYDFTIGW
jgi:hypothetical protein